MKSMKLGVWVLVGIGLAMLLSVGFLVPERSVSAQDNSTDPVFVGAGDIASCDRTADEDTAKLLDNIVAAAPSTTVFTTGDNAYESGTASEFTDCYVPNWGRHKAITRPTIGNHEYYETTDASGYFDYFGPAAGDPGKGYYSYDLGSWHMISLNSNCSFVAGGGCDRGSLQEQWLKDDLDRHSNACTLAYWHHPLFSSGSSSGGNSKMKPIWEALYAAKADVVLNGHVHNYERFAPQTPSGVADPAQGIREFVVGTGGYSLNTFKTKVANSELRDANNYGVLKLTLHPSGYDWQFVAVDGTVDGETTDSGMGSCSGNPPPSPDTEPPKVQSTIPSADETDVTLTTNVTATFSEEMDASSITGKTFKLFKKGSTTKIAAAAPTYDAATKTATLDPNSSLDSGVTYKAVVTTGAKDVAGNPLDQNPTKTGSQQNAWYFTTSN